MHRSAAVRCILRPSDSGPDGYGQRPSVGTAMGNALPCGSLLTPRRESTLTHGLEPPCTALNSALPDTPPPFFLCAWAKPFRGTNSVSLLGKRAHPLLQQVGGGENSQTILEFLPGVAGLQISDLNPRPPPRIPPKGQILVGLLSRGSLRLLPGTAVPGLGYAADRNRHSLRGPLSQQAGGGTPHLIGCARVLPTLNNQR